jgi:hypothetical protein
VAVSLLLALEFALTLDVPAETGASGTPRSDGRGCDFSCRCRRIKMRVAEGIKRSIRGLKAVVHVSWGVGGELGLTDKSP